HRSVATRVLEAAQVLFTGNNPVQIVQSTDVFAAPQVAIVRGRCVDRAGAPLTWVHITVKGHPEWGSTVSRADGRFDLAVNGGGIMTLIFSRAGNTTVDRTLRAPANDYLPIDDIVLSAYDATQTQVATASPQSQLARGSVTSDGSGTRQPTLHIPAGTLAGMTLPAGTSQSLDALHVRATEYTIGDRGDQAMPGSLPASSG